MCRYQALGGNFQSDQPKISSSKMQSIFFECTVHDIMKFLMHLYMIYLKKMIVAKSHETSFLDACSNLSSIANANWERSMWKTSFFFYVWIFLFLNCYRLFLAYHDIEAEKWWWERVRRKNMKKNIKISIFRKHHNLARCMMYRKVACCKIYVFNGNKI